LAFAAGGSVTGTVDGGAGTDTLDYSARTTPVSVNLGSNTSSLTVESTGSSNRICVPARNGLGTFGGRAKVETTGSSVTADTSPSHSR